MMLQKKKHKRKLSKFARSSYRILIIGGCGSGKTI